MDTPLSLLSLGLLLGWRGSLSVLMAAAAGWALGYLVHPLLGIAAFSTITTLGLVWQGGHVTREHGVPAPSRPLSWPVAFMGLALIGALWGGMVTEAAGSLAAGAAALLGSVVIFASWRIAMLKRPVPISKLVFACVALCAGLLALSVLALNHMPLGK